MGIFLRILNAPAPLFLDKSQLAKLTFQRFPNLPQDRLRWVAMEKGGSEREFWRVSDGNGTSMVLLQYNAAREENHAFVEVAKFLADCGVPVPKILAEDLSNHLVWVEDLGEIDLWHFRDESWAVRRPLYESALCAVARLHEHAIKHPDLNQVSLQIEFDEALYLWEQDYFFENCLGRIFSWSAEALETMPGRLILKSIASDLAKEPAQLIHRDFQSQNVMIRNQSAWLIDFQGLRRGLGTYDVASLLYDPYVSLTATERTELADFYAGTCGVGDLSHFKIKLQRCTIQRLMQALGAYGMLGIVKGKRRFLKSVPVALRSLAEVAAQEPGLAEFAALCGELAKQAPDFDAMEP